MNKEEKAPRWLTALRHRGPHRAPLPSPWCQQTCVMWKVLFCSTPHTHTHTHTPISLYPLPFSQFLTLCCWKGREDNQVATSMSSVHPLLPFTNETVSLSILATCQHSLMSTCSLGPISLAFFICYPIYSLLNLCFVNAVLSVKYSLIFIHFCIWLF